jgi:hypothetical protein
MVSLLLGVVVRYSFLVLATTNDLPFQGNGLPSSTKLPFSHACIGPLLELDRAIIMFYSPCLALAMSVSADRVGLVLYTVH